MSYGITARLVGIGICLAVLTGLFILGGMGWPMEKGTDIGPEVEELEDDFEEEVGNEIVESGEVVNETEPTVKLEDELGNNVTVRLEPADGHGELPPAKEDQEVAFIGEIEDGQVIAVDTDRLATRAPWEVQYMYGISIVGVILTALVVLNYWQINVRRLQVEPRTEPRFTFHRGDSNG